MRWLPIPAPCAPQRPGPDRWSPVDIVEHLSLVETRFSTIVGGKIADALNAGLGPESRAARALPERIQTMLGGSDGEADGARGRDPVGRDG